VAHQASQLEPALQNSRQLDLIVQWSVPVSSGGRLRSLLAWPRSHRNNFRVKPPISVRTFYKAFVQLFGPLSDLRPKDRAKYKNTVAFVNAMLTM
jgi:hypothetical protein